MPRARPKGLREWLAKKQRQRDQVVAQRTKLLPQDLATQIIEAAESEHALIIERVDAIDAEIERLKAVLTEVRAEARAADAPISVTPPSTWRNWRGELRHKSGRVGAVKTKESIEVGKRCRAIGRRIQVFERERGLRLREAREVRRVRFDAERGVIPALLSITNAWRNQVNLGGLQDRVKLGRSHAVWSDAAGYPLPDAALDARGQPLPDPPNP